MKNKVVFERLSCTLRALYYWGKFVGIVSLTITEGNELEFSYLSLLYGCILAATYCYVIYGVLMARLHFMTPIETPIAVIVDFVGIITVFLENSFTWLIVALFQDRTRKLVRCFVEVEKTSRKLDIAENYEKRFEQLGIKLTIVNVAYFTLLVINNAAMSFLPNFDWLIWTCYCVPRVASFNMGSIFLWSLAIVREKFRSLNEKLKFLMLNDRVVATEINVEVSSGLIGTRGVVDRIKVISQLHRELRDVINCIEDHFALLILFSCATQFTNITLNVYSIYRFAKLYLHMGGTAYAFLCAITFWIFLPVGILGFISNICSSTAYEANKTGNILHAMLNNNKNSCGSREAAKLNILSLDLLHNQVRMTLFGFFDLDSFLLFRSISTASTYLVIMLQFYS